MKTKTIFITMLVVLFTSLSFAGDITGKWKGKMSGQDGNQMELTFNFKVDGNVLTGSINSSFGDMQISNGKITGDDFTFDVDVNGNVMTNIGKVMGDKIKLSVKDMPMEMELIKEGAVASSTGASKIDGVWVSKVQGPEGDMEITTTFKVDGNKLTGTSASPMGETPLSNGKVNGNEFSYDIEFGDMKITNNCKYLPNDTIESKVSVMGQDMTMIFTRKK